MKVYRNIKSANPTALQTGLFLLATLVTLSSTAGAARISDLQEVSTWDQVVEFFSFSSPIAVQTLIGCSLLGLLGGLLGCFLVLRRISLVGDALGHAILPGIGFAFLIIGAKSTLPLLAGAIIAGLVYSLLLGFVSRQRRVRPDSALGLTFTAFFGLGIVLLSYIQNSPTGSQAGLDKFLFGQAAALSALDIKVSAILLIFAIIAIIALYKQLQVFSFDETFADSIGINTAACHYLMMVLFTLTIVISVQAVGVVLVVALLIIPATTAYLLVHRLNSMLILSGVLGLISGAVGSLFSYLYSGIPTGPMVVLASAAMFVLALLLAPEAGAIPRFVRKRRRRKRIDAEHLLKSLLEFNRKRGRKDEEAIPISEYASASGRDPLLIDARLKSAGKNKLLTIDPAGETVAFTEAGLMTARRVLRNHILWEIYLNEYTDIAPDHVHFDADRIEHVLTPAIIRRLEQILVAEEISSVDPSGGGA